MSDEDHTKTPAYKEKMRQANQHIKRLDKDRKMEHTAASLSLLGAGQPYKPTGKK